MTTVCSSRDIVGMVNEYEDEKKIEYKLLDTQELALLEMRHAVEL